MRKTASVFVGFLLIFALLAGSCGCARSAAQTPASLLRALGEAAPAYAFPAEALLYKDGTWFAFYSLHGENDLLLTLRTDEKRQILRAAVTAKNGSEAADRELAPFGLLLCRLLTGENADAIAAVTGLALLPQPPAQILSLAPCAWGRAGLFCGTHALCFFVELRGYAESVSGETLSDSAEAEFFSSDAVTRSAEAETNSPEAYFHSADSDSTSSDMNNFSAESENFSLETP